MGTKWTHLLAGLAVVATGAQADDEGGLMTSLAICAGRFSAEVEHAWLVGASDPEILADRRDATLALLEQVTDAAQSVHTLDLRIRAKHAHARLLLHARFHTDRDVSSRSRRLATMGIRVCHSMHLG